MRFLLTVLGALLLSCASATPTSDYVTRDELRRAYECLQSRHEYERQAEICRATPPATVSTEGALCTDTCGPPDQPNAWVGDGECDDGGENSLYAVCALGTDCQDCGPRTPEGASVAGAAPVHSQQEIDTACGLVTDYFEQCPGIR